MRFSLNSQFVEFSSNTSSIYNGKNNFRSMRNSFSCFKLQYFLYFQLYCAFQLLSNVDVQVVISLTFQSILSRKIPLTNNTLIHDRLQITMQRKLVVRHVMHVEEELLRHKELVHRRILLLGIRQGVSQNRIRPFLFLKKGTRDV